MKTHRLLASVAGALGLGACTILSPLDYLSEGSPNDAGSDAVETSNDAPAAPTPPVSLATGQNLPGAIALDDDTVYWANAGSGAIMAMRKDGSIAAHALAAKTGSNPTATAVEPGPGSVYWVGTTAGTVQSIGKAGAADAGLLASGQDSPAGIAVDAQFVYWIDRTDGGGGAGLVQRVPKGGGAKTLVSDDSAGDPSAVSVDSTNLYVAHENPGHEEPESGVQERADRRRTEAELVGCDRAVIGDRPPEDRAVDGARLEKQRRERHEDEQAQVDEAVPARVRTQEERRALEVSR